jgi:hypothetical protein
VLLLGGLGQQINGAHILHLERKEVFVVRGGRAWGGSVGVSLGGLPSEQLL